MVIVEDHDGVGLSLPSPEKAEIYDRCLFAFSSIYNGICLPFCEWCVVASQKE
jgi:hypothetical protein